MMKRGIWLGWAILGACAGDGGSSPSFAISNGVEPLAGVDRAAVTTLAGECEAGTDDGSILCDGLVIRLNAPDVYGGIGYHVIDPIAPTCAGSSVRAPRIAVFSFGSLEIPAGSTLYVRGPEAVALVAAGTLEIGGAIRAWPCGGFVGDTADLEIMGLSTGPSPGATVSGETPEAAGGAGGSTPGGRGGNDGGAGGAAIAPQIAPLCGGSGGGSVGHYSDGGSSVWYAVGGNGGPAVLLAAGDAIDFDGPFGCGVTANGGTGTGDARAGGGGGAGGTILLEAPTITVGGDCELTALGGAGHSSQSGSPGGASGDGVVPGGDGAPGEYGGGGGGSAGFIRVRTSSCPLSDRGILPAPLCDEL